MQLSFNSGPLNFSFLDSNTALDLGPILGGVPGRERDPDWSFSQRRLRGCGRTARIQVHLLAVFQNRFSNNYSQLDGVLRLPVGLPRGSGLERGRMKTADL